MGELYHQFYLNVKEVFIVSNLASSASQAYIGSSNVAFGTKMIVCKY